MDLYLPTAATFSLYKHSPFDYLSFVSRAKGKEVQAAPSASFWDQYYFQEALWHRHGVSLKLIYFSFLLELCKFLLVVFHFGSIEHIVRSKV